MYTKDNIIGIKFRTATGNGQVYTIEKFNYNQNEIILSYNYDNQIKNSDRKLAFALNSLNSGHWIVTFTPPSVTEPNYSIF